MSAKNFSSAGAYKRWLAYDKMNISKSPSKHPVAVSIRGKTHKVSHKVNRAR